MSKRLSKTQEEVMMILAEGVLYVHLDDHSYSLEDADHNSYRIRYDTIAILLRAGMIAESHSPNIYTVSYRLNHAVAEPYLRKYQPEFVKQLTGE